LNHVKFAAVVRWSPLVALLAWLACSSEGSPSTSDVGPTSARPITTTTTTTTTTALPTQPAPLRSSEPRVTTPAPKNLPYARWLVENCTLDALEPTPYSRAWIRYPKPADWLRSTDPSPLFDARLLPPPGSDAATTSATALERAWLSEPQSHVVDCSFRLQPRECEHCVKQVATLVRYVAYLPERLFRAPHEVESALLLVPGGHGGRSRAFLRPIPGLTVWDKGSGGLDSKALADDLYAKRPDLAQSIVVSLENSGIQHGSGAIEFLTFDIADHVRRTFLSEREAPLVLGVDGVSSGAREIVRATRAKPERFRSVGLHCMACGGIHPDRGFLAPREELLALGRQLAERRARGLFDLRMSIGSRDNQLPCNRRWWALFEEAGLVGAADAELFHVVPGALHDFLFLAQAFPAHLEWHLSILGRRDGAAGAP
jgi:hypothetical protein